MKSFVSGVQEGVAGWGCVHPTLHRVAGLLSSIGLKVFIIGARSVIVHGVDLGRETRDWGVVIDKPFTPELRDRITSVLRRSGFKVQWRKWGVSRRE